jgi:hypothetical protein
VKDRNLCPVWHGTECVRFADLERAGNLKSAGVRNARYRSRNPIVRGLVRIIWQMTGASQPAAASGRSGKRISHGTSK